MEPSKNGKKKVYEDYDFVTFKKDDDDDKLLYLDFEDNLYDTLNFREDKKTVLEDCSSSCDYQATNLKKLQASLKVELREIEDQEGKYDEFGTIMDGRNVYDDPKMFGREAYKKHLQQKNPYEAREAIKKDLTKLRKSFSSLFDDLDRSVSRKEVSRSFSHLDTCVKNIARKEEKEDSSSEEENIYESIDNYSDISVYSQNIYESVLAKYERHFSTEDIGFKEETIILDNHESEEFMSTKSLKILNTLIESEVKYVEGLGAIANFIKDNDCSISMDLSTFYQKQQKFMNDLKMTKTKLESIIQVFGNHDDLFELYPQMGKFLELMVFVSTKSKEKFCITHPLSRLRQYIHFIENCRNSSTFFAPKLSEIMENLQLCMTKANSQLALQSIRQQIFKFHHTGAFCRRHEFEVKIRNKRKIMMVFLFEKIIIFTKLDIDKTKPYKTEQFKFKISMSIEHIVEIKGRNRTIEILKFDALSQTNEKISMKSNKSADISLWVKIINDLRSKLN